jgi:hypothetical protein
MKKEILEEKVYYYTDAIDNFDKFMKTIDELDSIGSPDGETNNWNLWTSSNDKSFIYGVTKTFDPVAIRGFDDPIKDKMAYIYQSIMDTFYKISKDYALALGDIDEPKIFPVFNIKKYNPNTDMGSHFDQLDGDKTLRYSLVMYLNDDCEGGEISFQLKDYDGGWTSDDGWISGAPAINPDYEVAVNEKSIDFGIKPKANSVIIFPSGAPYFHTAHRVKSGIKYMVPGHWIHNSMNFHRSM